MTYETRIFHQALDWARSFRLQQIEKWLTHEKKVEGDAGYRAVPDRRARRRLRYDRGGDGA